MKNGMKKIWLLSAQEMKRADQAAIEEFGMPSCVLMERAALCVAEEIEKRFAPGSRVLIVAGCGNNGGDGIAAGRILLQHGYRVDAVLMGDREILSPETDRQIGILEKYGCPVQSKMKNEEYDIVVDALFGIGLSRKVEGRFSEGIRRMNEMNAFVCAVDIPSGISADTGEVLGTAVKADMTVTFAFEKLGHIRYPGFCCAGELILRDIGITEDGFSGKSMPGVYTFRNDIRDGLPKRDGGGNKGTFGKALIIAGSVNMSGACELCAGSAYRTGAGMVRVVTPEENREIVQKKLPEALLSTYSVPKEGENGPRDLTAFLKRLSGDMSRADCIAAGPGIGKGAVAAVMVRQALLETDKPLILDADALNLLAESQELKTALARRRGPVILTPHVAECARLYGCSTEEIKRDILTKPKELACRWKCVVVCKDARTVVAVPGEEAVYLNTTGNDGMATAGSGDVLTGIITGLVAQGMEVNEAARLGVYIHGVAGDRAAERMGRYALMAGDLREELKTILQ